MGSMRSLYNSGVAPPPLTGCALTDRPPAVPLPYLELWGAEGARRARTRRGGPVHLRLLRVELRRRHLGAAGRVNPPPHPYSSSFLLLPLLLPSSFFLLLRASR